MLKRGFSLQVLGYSLIFFLLSTVYCTLYPTFAAEEFASSYDVLYDIDSSGITTVAEKINLTNLTSEYYASEFKLTVGATEVFDITASDGGGNMEVSSEQKDTSTTIIVKFSQQVVGLNKVLPWRLQFKTKDFAEKLGKIWEVRTPRVSSSTNLTDYNLTIFVPLEFGEPTLISPTPKTQTTTANKLLLTFTKDQLLQSGVSASFGNKQIFDFDLAYHLENDNLVPILTNIALPPDTAYQDIIYKSMTPAPLNVTLDEDGNYLAWFRVKRGEKLDISLKGAAKLYTKSKVKNPSLDLNLRKKYTESNKYWEKDHPTIQAKLKDILGSSPPSDTGEKAKLIYQYVVNSLKYDSSRLKDNIERFGAVTALNNPNSAVCMEFTDLFVALSRAAGIPARELDGYAYTANTKLRPLSLSRDILHAWPEIWIDGKGWVMVDPTWENTTAGVDYFNKLDLNHFVFAIKGSSSQSPVPAGSYKFKGTDSQDVKVNLSEEDFLGESKLDVQINTSNPILAGFPQKIKVKVTNLGNAVYPSNNLSITASRLAILGGSQKFGSIPPFGSASFDLNVRTKSLFDTYSDQIIVMVGSQKFTKEILIKPLLIFQTLPAVALGIVSLMGLVYLLILIVKIYRRFSKKTTSKVKS